jgi:hypothetical protein
MLQQLAFHAQQAILATSVQDLDPRPCADNAHVSVLPHEMAAMEPGENPTRTLTWKSLAFLSHIKRRSNDDRFPLPLMGDLVLLQPRCTTPGSAWTCSIVCMQLFSL